MPKSISGLFLDVDIPFITLIDVASTSCQIKRRKSRVSLSKAFHVMNSMVVVGPSSAGSASSPATPLTLPVNIIQEQLDF